jgi:hypothetical protein
MTHLEQHDGFDLVRAAIPTCTLDGCGAQAQKQRYRAIAPFIINVRQEAMTVVVEFANDLDGAAVDEAIAVEHQCCGPLLNFEFDRLAHSLRVTATGADASPALDLIAAGFRRRLTR